MPDVSVIVHARDRYRVVRLDCDGADPGGPDARYLVIDTAGVELRRELSLDDAKAWIELVAGNGVAARIPPPCRTRR